MSIFYFLDDWLVKFVFFKKTKLKDSVTFIYINDIKFISAIVIIYFLMFQINFLSKPESTQMFTEFLVGLKNVIEQPFLKKFKQFIVNIGFPF
jgi:hypothetical protein